MNELIDWKKSRPTSHVVLEEQVCQKLSDSKDPPSCPFPASSRRPFKISGSPDLRAMFWARKDTISASSFATRFAYTGKGPGSAGTRTEDKKIAHCIESAWFVGNNLSILDDCFGVTGLA
mmetsp:Transcript_20819/g.46948  ORF Transcript_20819/g.46948 Transcript_20819/m.46948 type:complete len:120 (+) Transcript_20819:453-812(+)